MRSFGSGRAPCSPERSAELARFHAFLAGFVQDRVDPILEVLLFLLKRANLDVDRFALVASPEAGCRW
jgi:hypothetical protein